MKRGDLILIGIVIVAALAFIVPKWLLPDTNEHTNHNVYAEITIDGKLYKQVPLTEEEQTIEVATDHGVNILKIHDHGIEMYEADCPDQLCVNFGFVTRKGETIVCLPHRVLVELKSDAAGESDTDAVVS